MARSVILGGVGALAVVAALAVASPPRTAAAGCNLIGNPILWDGEAGTSSWSEPTNWSTDLVPGPGADVCIPEEAGSVTFDASSASVATIEVGPGAGLVVTTGTLDISGPDASRIGNLAVTGGVLSGTGPRTVTGTLALYGGTLSGSATTSVASGGELLIGSSGAQGRVTITAGHVLRIEEGATAIWGPVNTDIQLDAPASIVNAGSLTIANDTLVFGSGTFANPGSITKASHLQTTIVVPFDNDGSVEVAAGTLEIQADGGQGTNGTFSLADSSHLRTSTGSITLGAEASIGGSGGTLDVISGSLTVPPTAAFDVGSITVSSGTFTLDGERSVENLALFGGTLAGTGSRAVSGSLALYGGVLSGSATTSVASGGELFIGASGGQNRITITGGQVLRVDEGATGSWGPVNTDVQLDAPSSIVNAGTFRVTNDTQVFGTGTIVNQGTLTKSSGLQTTLVVPVDNDGSIELAAGTLEIQADGGQGSDGSFTLADSTHLRTSTGSITLGAEASIVGQGVLDVISGSLAVPATATLEVGSVTLSSGTLTLDGERSLESLSVFGGTLAGSGARTVTGSLVLYGGALGGTATTSVASGGELLIGAGGGQNRITITGGHVVRLEDGATGTWGPVNTDIQVDTPSSIVNAGTFTITNDTQVFGTGALVNEGTLTKASHLVTTLVAPFDNQGTVEVASGTLDVQGEGLDNGATVRVGPRAIVRTTAYAQTESAVLEIGVAVSGERVSFGQVVVTVGPAVLRGTLALTAPPEPQVPTDTRMLVVPITGSRDGGFADVTLPTSIIGVSVQYEDQGVVVEVN